MLALPSVTVSDVVNHQHPELTEVQVPYSSRKDFEAQAKKMKIMFDLRVSVHLPSLVPRVPLQFTR